MKPPWPCTALPASRHCVETWRLKFQVFSHIAWPHHRECWFRASSCGSTWLHRDARMAFQRRIETCLAGPVVTMVSIWYARSALSAVSLEYTVCCTNVGLARNLLILESPRASLTFTPTPEIQQAPSTVRTRQIKQQNLNLEDLPQCRGDPSMEAHHSAVRFGNPEKLQCRGISKLSERQTCKPLSLCSRTSTTLTLHHISSSILLKHTKMARQFLVVIRVIILFFQFYSRIWQTAQRQ
jgi:hypothetical protein